MILIISNILFKVVKTLSFSRIFVDICAKIMLRPSSVEFFEWAENGSNVSRIRNALKTYPDLIRIRDNVRFNLFVPAFFSYLIFLP